MREDQIDTIADYFDSAPFIARLEVAAWLSTFGDYARGRAHGLVRREPRQVHVQEKPIA